MHPIHSSLFQQSCGYFSTKQRFPLRPCTGDAHLAVDGHRPVEDAVHAQNGGLRGVDDGCAEHGAEHAPVADGEGASVHIFNSELVVTSLRHMTQIGKLNKIPVYSLIN